MAETVLHVILNGAQRNEESPEPCLTRAIGGTPEWLNDSKLIQTSAKFRFNQPSGDSSASGLRMT
jgi:hypothetical protein